MCANWMDELKKEARKRVSGVVAEATQRAMYRVQRDFHTKVIDEIANQTGHANLAQACYCMLNPQGGDIAVDIYYDASFIDGFFSSNSSFHKSGSPWRVVKSNYGLSSYDFWEMRLNGEYEGGSYGAVMDTWIMQNFWNGVKYSTNGWPRARSEEYLEVYKTRTVAAYDVAQGFIDDYIAAGHYEQYIQEEMNNLTR